MEPEKDRADADGPSLAELIKALQDGKEPKASEAAIEIGIRFQPLIRRYWRQSGSGEYADFYQEVMVRLFRALPMLRESLAFPGLLRRIVVGTLSDHWRRTADEHSHRSDIDLENVPEIAIEPDLDAALLVSAYLDLLPKREADVLRMWFLMELPTSQIARRLGIGEGAVRVMKTRALRRVKGLVRDM